MKNKIKRVTSKIYFLLFVVLTLLVFNGILIVLSIPQNEETQVPTLNSYEENIKKYLDGKDVKNVEDTTETLSPTKKTEAYNNDGLAYLFTEVPSKGTTSSVTKRRSKSSNTEENEIISTVAETSEDDSDEISITVISPDLSTISTEHPHLFFYEDDIQRVKDQYDANYGNNRPLFYYDTYFDSIGSINFDDSDYYEDDKSENVFKLGFKCIIIGNIGDCENAYVGLKNVGKSNRRDSSSAPGGILQRARALNNYIRAYDYTYNYIQANHPGDIPEIEDLLMSKALAFVVMLNSDGNDWPYLQSSERHIAQMVVGLVALTLPHYQRDSLTFCGKDTETTCSQTYIYPDDAPAGWGSDVNSQDMLEYVMQGAFGTEPSSVVRAYNPDYFDEHFFTQKSRDGVEAGNAKEYHGQYLIYPFLFAWDHLFGPSDSLLYDLRAMADANVELRAPNGWIFNYQETPSDHFGHSYAGAYIAYKYGGDVEKYFVYPKKVIDDTGRGNFEQYNLGDIFFSIWNNELETAYDNADISDLSTTSSQSTIFPDGGVAVLRDGYEKDSTAILLYANHKYNDKFGFGAHQGSWQIYSKGTYMVKSLKPTSSTTISGLPEADPLQNDRLGDDCNPSTFAKSAAGANAILVDNYGARNVYRSNKMYDPAYFGEDNNQYIFDEKLDYVEIEVTYDEDHITQSTSCGNINPPEPAGIKVDRHFIFPKNYLIIVDETSGAENSHEYSFNMWMGSGSTSKSTNKITYTEGSSILESFFITPISISTYSAGLVKAKINDINPTFISVHYPRFSTESEPTITTLTTQIQGGVGGKINGDYIAYKTGTKITISDLSIETDAEIMFVSSYYFFVKDATYMEIDGTSYGVGSGTGIFLRDCFDTCESLGYECGYVCGELCGECGIGEDCIDGKCVVTSLADLQPTEITYYSWTEPIKAGMWIYFDSGIENTGTQDAENSFNIKWFLDDEEVRYGSHSPVEAGETVMDDNSAYVWDVAMPGTHTIKFVVNADTKHVDESDYNNNEIELEFEIPENCKYFVTEGCDYIDLKAGEITHSGGGAGVPMTFSSSMSNIGTMASDPFNVKWFVDGEQKVYGSFRGLTVGETIQGPATSYIWDSPTSGEHTITFSLNVDRHFAELGYNNNEVSVVVNVP